MNHRSEQTVCQWKDVLPEPPAAGSIIGLAIPSLATGKGILHGLRHPPAGNTNGWYIWSGNYSEDPDFFQPVCLEHLQHYISRDIHEYLELPPGYRFLTDGLNDEDVWYDSKLLDI